MPPLPLLSLSLFKGEYVFDFKLDDVIGEVMTIAEEQRIALPYDNIVLSAPVTYPVEFSVLLVGVEKLDAIQRSRLSTALAIMLVSDPITVAIVSNTTNGTLYSLPFAELGCNPGIGVPANGETFPFALNVTLQARRQTRMRTRRAPP